jgi:ABC-type nitrate/sulfonate/bicarbonate transport system ATPase subunit
MRRIMVIGGSGAGKSTRPRIVAALEKFAGQAQLHRLKSRKNAERFMATIERR